MDLERLGTIFTVFLAGIAAIAAMVFTVFLFTFLMDKISFCNTAVLTEEEMEERRNATRVTKQSGLAGLLKDERNRIYRVFFERRSFPYLQAPETTTATQMKEHHDTKEDMDVPQESNEDERNENKHVESGDSIVKESDIEDGQAPTCSICLCEYGKPQSHQ